MEVKSNIKVIGDWNWQEFRDYLVIELVNAETEEQFTKIVANILGSVGTLQDIKKVRRKLGIKQITKEEEKMLGGFDE
ncbi:MAG: hypothetical protein AABY22_09735 [Nanoarchaeota archaeon]